MAFSTVLLSLCFAAGLSLRAHFAETASESQVFISLFHQTCGDVIRGTEPILSSNITKIKIGPDKFLWAESEYSLSAEWDKNYCHTSDILKDLPDGFSENVASNIEEYVDANFNDYQRYQFNDETGAEIHLIWSSSPEDFNCSPFIRLLRIAQIDGRMGHSLSWQNPDKRFC